ncbi:MAG: hypothetical protein PHV23_05050 [Candidatus Gracilibacteria bacterium]|nr:hypothetical protein [Candidatus Gracilibacteria bacterium]
MKKILFICKANVGRSQIAEAVYNNYTKSNKAISIAGCEDRKEKYNGKPSIKITDFIIKKGIDMLNQNINFITDFHIKDIENIEKVIFLYNPIKENIIDRNCMINGISPYKYFLKNFPDKITILDIKDPYNLGLNEIEDIYLDIDNLVKKII